MALDDLVQGDDPEMQIEYNVAAVTPIAASQDILLLEGIGWINEIYVVVERGQQRFLTRGGVYSHYEFEWPIQPPLTNAFWAQMLLDGQTPPRLEWVTEFVIPTSIDNQE